MRQHSGHPLWLAAFLGFFCAFSATARAACDATDSTLPEINFNAGQTVGYGDSVAVQVYASKPLCTPLQIGYNIAGTATPIADHDAIDGVVTLADDNSAQIIFHTVAKSASGVPDKTIEFTLQASTEWRAGVRAIHVVVLSETTMTPRVSVLVQQNMDYAFLHPRVQQTCATCHDGSNATGKTPTHPAAPASFECNSCHGSTTSIASSTRFVHPVISSNCASCHAENKSPSHFPAPIGTDCSMCHYITPTTLSWIQATFDHATVTEVRCDSCHSGVFAAAKARPPLHIAVSPSVDCKLCHHSTASFAASTSLDHAGLLTGCNSCHLVDLPPATHIPFTREFECGACHNIPPPFGWIPASLFSHTVVTTMRCDACHITTFVGFANVPGPKHVAINGQDCSVCHNNAAWIPTTPTTATLARALNSPALPRALVDVSPRIGRVLSRDQGKVALLAQVTSNTTREYHYSWDASSLGWASVVGKNTAWLTLDPASLTAGSYHITVTVNEVDFPERTSTVNVDLLVVDTLPALSETNDVDGDGIVDAREDYGDEDDNGIAAFAESIIADNILPIHAYTAGANVVHSTPGQKLALGQAAFTAQNNAATVSTATLLSHGTITADAANAITSHSLLDIRVNEIVANNNIAEIVMPLASSGSALLFLTRSGTWAPIDNSTQESIAFTTTDAAGNCPNTRSSAYQTTATANSHCVELRIQDNGELDLATDNNGEVRFIVAIAEPTAPGGGDQPVVTNNNDSGGGSFGFGLGALLAAFGFHRRRRAIRACQSPGSPAP